MANVTATTVPAPRRRTFTGTVEAAKSKLTATVVVERVKVHPKYGKRQRVSLRLHCHNPADRFKAGDRVRVEECRPLSRTKRWRIVGAA